MSSPTSPTSSATPVVRTATGSFASAASTSHRSAAGVAEAKQGRFDRFISRVRDVFSSKKKNVDTDLSKRTVAPLGEVFRHTREAAEAARKSSHNQWECFEDHFATSTDTTRGVTPSTDDAAPATLPEESDVQKLERELNEADQMIALGKQRRALASCQMLEVKERAQIEKDVQPGLAQLGRSFEAGRAHIQAKDQARKELEDAETQARQEIGDLESQGHFEQSNVFGQLNLMHSEEQRRKSVETDRFAELRTGYDKFNEGRLTILYREMDPSDLAVEYSKLASDETKADSLELKCMKAVLKEKGLLGTPEGNALLKTAEKVIKLANELAIARDQIHYLTRDRVPSATPQRPTRRTGGMLGTALTARTLPAQEVAITSEKPSSVNQAVGYFLTIAALSFIGYQVYQHAEFTDEQKALVEQAKKFFTKDQMTALGNQAKDFFGSVRAPTKEEMREFVVSSAAKLAPYTQPAIAFAKENGDKIASFVGQVMKKQVAPFARDVANGASELASQGFNTVVRNVDGPKAFVAAHAVAATAGALSHALAPRGDKSSATPEVEVRNPGPGMLSRPTFQSTSVAERARDQAALRRSPFVAAATRRKKDQ